MQMAESGADKVLEGSGWPMKFRRVPVQKPSKIFQAVGDNT